MTIPAISNLEIGDRVYLHQGDIARSRGKDRNGVIKNFTRFSPYHPREAFVTLDDGSSGWFWIYDLERAP
mgnify:FL=1